MKEELEAQLVKQFPLCFGDYGKDMRETCMYWGCSFSDGWFNLMKETCEKLEPLIKKYIEEHPDEEKDWYPRFSQLKEKYGMLSIYWASATDEMYAITDAAEEKSCEICEQCGVPGKIRGQGWLYCACYKCSKPGDRDNLEMVEDAYEKKEKGK